MSNYEFKKIGDVDVIESVSDLAHVIIEDSGILKKMAAKNIGAVKSVNGITPDENGNVAVEVPEINYPVTSVNGMTGDVVIEAGQPDWNQNDSTAADYVKNRTHYDAGTPKEFAVFSGESLLFEEVESNDGSGTMYLYTMQESDVFSLTAGNIYYVTIDDITYTTEAMSMEGIAYIGNLSFYVPMFPNTGESFLILPDEGICLNTPGETHNISITEMKSVVEKEIVSDNDYTFSVMMSGMLPMLINIGGFDFSNISAGDLLTVTFDGVNYTNTVELINDGIVFGNLGLLGEGENTGEPYLAMFMEGMSAMYVLVETVQNQFSVDKILADGTYENIVSDRAGTFTFGEGVYTMSDTESGFILEADTAYRVVWNGTEYTCTSVSEEITSGETTETMVRVGNIGKLVTPDDSTDDSGEPFVLSYSPSNGFMVAMFVDESFTSTHRIKIDGYVSGVKKLDKKYIPSDIDIPVASRSTVGGVKVYGTSIGLSSDSNYSKIYLNTDDNRIYAKKPTMSSLTFTGGVTGSYDGSSAKTVNIPKIVKSTTDLTEGVSSLTTGEIYLVYE